MCSQQAQQAQPFLPFSTHMNQGCCDYHQLLSNDVQCIEVFIIFKIVQESMVQLYHCVHSHHLYQMLSMENQVILLLQLSDIVCCIVDFFSGRYWVLVVCSGGFHSTYRTTLLTNTLHEYKETIEESESLQPTNILHVHIHILLHG